MSALEITQQILKECLQIEGDVTEISESLQLAGCLPEFNSLTIAAIITSIEDEVDCVIDDDELSIELFETVGTLAEFVAQKM